MGGCLGWHYLNFKPFRVGIHNKKGTFSPGMDRRSQCGDVPRDGLATPMGVRMRLLAISDSLGNQHMSELGSQCPSRSLATTRLLLQGFSSGTFRDGPHEAPAIPADNQLPAPPHGFPTLHIHLPGRAHLFAVGKG